MVAVGPPGLTIRLWVSHGSAGRAWYQRLFGRPPGFTPFGNDALAGGDMTQNSWPSGSAMTTQLTSPWPMSMRVAPSEMRRSTSAC